MKLLHLGTVLSAAVFSFMACFHAANAQDPDFACFMTTESGQVIDLSKSVCGSSKKSVPVVDTNSDFANSKAVIEQSKRKLSEEKALRQEALRLIQAKKEKVSGSSTAYTENVPAPSATYIPR